MSVPPVPKTIRLPAALWTRIADYQHAAKMPTLRAAVESLIRDGLSWRVRERSGSKRKRV